MDVLEQEAKLFTRYLVGRKVSPQATRLYKTAMADSRPNATAQKLLDFMHAHPWSIGFIDAGLVFYDSSSEARRRLYVMFAILEASVEYHDCFLPKQQSPFYAIVVMYSGVRAVVRAVLGVLLVKVLA